MTPDAGMLTAETVALEIKRLTDRDYDEPNRWAWRQRLALLLQSFASLRPTTEDAATVYLDAECWKSIKEAVKQSSWIPAEYYMNDWVSDVCGYLRGNDGNEQQPHAPAAPAEDGLVERLRDENSYLRAQVGEPEGMSIAQLRITQYPLICDAAIVEKYRAMIKAGQNLPAILAAPCDNGFAIWDGHHRYFASILEGKDGIDVCVTGKPAHAVDGLLSAQLKGIANHIRQCAHLDGYKWYPNLQGDADIIEQAAAAFSQADGDEAMERDAARYRLLRHGGEFAVMLPRKHGHIMFTHEGLDEKIDTFLIPANLAAHRDSPR